MIREWATVRSWQDGVAYVSCDIKRACGSCQARSSCGTRLLTQSGSQQRQTIAIAWDAPLQPGQQVELGISERSLLLSASLVYLTPLAGFFCGAIAAQSVFGGDIAAFIGGFLGGAGGFFIARQRAKQLNKSSSQQPVILQVGSLATSVIATKSVS